MNLIIFDVDGTLLDSRAQMLRIFSEAFDTLGLPQLEDEKVLSIVGLSLQLACDTLVGPGEASKQLADYYRKSHLASQAQGNHTEPPLYSGIGELVSALSQRDDVTLGIATGSSRRGLDHLIAYRGWGDVFATTQTADDAPSKPHPAMILQAMEETGIGPERTVMVGDTSYDIEMAVSAGVASIGVTWGNHKADILRKSGASQILSTREELASALNDFCIRSTGAAS